MKQKLRSMLLCGVASATIFTSCIKDENHGSTCGESFTMEYQKSTPDVPAKWYALAITLSRTTPAQTGPTLSRTYGYMGLVLYESVVPGMPAHQSIQRQLNGLPGLAKVDCEKKYYYPASANAALASIVRHMFSNASPAQNLTIDSLENALNGFIKANIPAPVFERSVAFGQVISSAIYNWSVTDGGDKAYLNLYPATYTPPTGPGFWVPQTGQLAQLPYWGNNRTFIKKNAMNTQPVQPPPAYSTDPSSQFYKEEMEIYKESLNQDPEHRAIALYWAALPPPSVSISILSSVLASKNADLFTAAEAYCKVGIATADAMIACYKTKYKYSQLRPITYIRANFDAAWVSLIPTPPFPDYTSAHSTQTGACAQVLAGIFGDNTTFTDNSINDLGFTPRTFTKFSDYANEVGLSRIYGGIHLRSSNFIGLDQGNIIGRNVSELHFRNN